MFGKLPTALRRSGIISNGIEEGLLAHYDFESIRNQPNLACENTAAPAVVYCSRHQERYTGARQTPIASASSDQQNHTRIECCDDDSLRRAVAPSN
jgi:hypothetical protein